MSHAPANLFGKLTLTLHEAKSLYNTQLIGRQNPFAVFSIGKNQQQTKVYKHGGSVATWNTSAVFALEGKDSDLELEVFSQNTLLSDSIGKNKISLADIVSKKEPTWYPIVRGAAHRGDVLISATFISQNSVLAPQAVVAPVESPPVRLPGLDTVRVSAGGSHYLMLTASNGNYYVWSAEKGNWVQQPGAAANASIGADGEMWVCTPQSSLYRFNSAHGTWVHIPGAAKQISVGNFHQIAIVTADGHVALWKGYEMDDPTAEGKQQQLWSAVAGLDQVQEVAIGDDGDLWAVTADRSLHHYTQGAWKKAQGVPGRVTHVGVGDAHHVVICNADSGAMHRLNASDSTWVAVKGFSARCCDIAKDGTYLGGNLEEVWFGKTVF